MRLDQFKGIVPRYPSHLLGKGFATIAHNVRLENACLEAWRQPLPVAPVPKGTKYVYQWRCCWLHWDKCVEVAEWHAHCPRLFVTGNAPYPEVVTVTEDCMPLASRLGVPAPQYAPTVSDTVFTIPSNENGLPMSEQRESRSYVYTYVNRFGEEGAPSYPSRLIDVDDGSPVTLSGFQQPDNTYHITHINIYRSATGQRADKEVLGNVSFATSYHLIATIPIGQATYIDTGRSIDVLGEVLVTQEVAEPPVGLRGITAIPNTLLLVGFVGNSVCFSLNNQPWNWPESHRYVLDDNVVAIVPFLNYLLVATDGAPYIITLNEGSDLRAPHAVLRMDTPMPMIRCCDAKGAIAIDKGMAYISSKGIVVVTPRGVTLLTSAWFSPSDWARLKPETMHLGYAHGALYISSIEKTWVLFLDDELWGEGSHHRLTTIDHVPQQWHRNRQGELFLLDDGIISQWDAGDTYLTYTWQSAESLSARFGYIGAIRLWANGAINVTILAEGEQVLPMFMLSPNYAKRLPRYGHHLSHQISLSGTYKVMAIEVATTIRDLART